MELSHANSLQLFVGVPSEDNTLCSPEQVVWLNPDLTTDLHESA